jgi:ABC-type spermidine/putrescine transport system permease subunit II
VVAALTVAIAAIVVTLAVLAARDMDRRGHNGEAYALAVLFVPPIGLLLWALDRRRPSR